MLGCLAKVTAGAFPKTLVFGKGGSLATSAIAARLPEGRRSAFHHERTIVAPLPFHLNKRPLTLITVRKRTGRFHQVTLSRAAKPRTEIAGLPVFAQRRPRHLRRDDVIAAILAAFAAETRCLTADTVSTRPDREVELVNLDRQTGRAKIAVLKGLDATMLAEEMKIWTERRKVPLAELDAAQGASTGTALLHPDLGRLYRETVGQLSAAFQDEALRARAFEKLRPLIGSVALTPEDGDLTIDLRGELASILLLCAEPEPQNASTDVTEEA